MRIRTLRFDACYYVIYNVSRQRMISLFFLYVTQLQKRHAYLRTCNDAYNDSDSCVVCWLLVVVTTDDDDRVEQPFFTSTMEHGIPCDLILLLGLKRV